MKQRNKTKIGVFMQVELTTEEVTLITRILKETQFGGDFETVSKVVEIMKGLLVKLDEPSSS